MLLDDLRRLNPGLDLKAAEDASFGLFGEVLEGEWPGLVAALEASAPIPAEGVVYVPSHPPLEACGEAARIGAFHMGGMPTQTGYCSGRNSTLNGLEYHKCSEIIVAADDFVLLLGHRSQLEAGPQGPTWDSARASAFLLRRGMAVELYTGTLHLAPCRAREAGFRAAIILAAGTNLEFAPGERPEGDPLLRKRNKWILAHPERKPLLDQGVLPLIKGGNLAVTPVKAGT
jgi:hypothetical protein